MLQAHHVYTMLHPENQPFLLGALAPFTEEWYLETNLWVLGCLLSLGCYCL